MNALAPVLIGSPAAKAREELATDAEALIHEAMDTYARLFGLTALHHATNRCAKRIVRAHPNHEREGWIA